MICDGIVNLRMPDAGWEPESCTRPKEPTKNNTYYDYDVYLNPKDYTLKKGHTLKLYIISLGGQSTTKTDNFMFVDSPVEPMEYMVAMASKYEFTVDNRKSYVEVPVVG